METSDKDLIEEKTGSEKIFDGNLLHVYKDTVKLPNGGEATREWIKHPGASAVIPLTDDGQVILVKQYRYPIGRITLEIPAGKLDAPGEPKIECAYRELEEETGYRCEKLEYLLSLNTTVAFCDEAIDIFLARHLIPSEQHLDPDEEINVEAWELSDLMQLIYEGKMTDGKTVAAIMTYAAKYGREQAAK